MKTMKTRTTFVALAIALPLSLAACGGSTDAATTSPGAGSTPAATSSDSMTSSTPMDTMTSSASMDPMADTFGEGCAAVPKDGKGSFSGMATDPVATAASNNPLLSTLVTAVKEAGSSTPSTRLPRSRSSRRPMTRSPRSRPPTSRPCSPTSRP